MKHYLILLTATLFAANAYSADAAPACKMEQALQDFANRCTGINESDLTPKTKASALMTELEAMRPTHGGNAAIMRQLFVIATRPTAVAVAAVAFPPLQ